MREGPSVGTGGALYLRAPEGIRTPNLLIRSQMLYPLSYGRMCYSVVPGFPGVAEARGFEPPVPVKGQLISSESHSAALARLLEPSLRGHRSFRTAEQKGYSSYGPDDKTAGQRRLLSNQSKILVCESTASPSSASEVSARWCRPG